MSGPAPAAGAECGCPPEGRVMLPFLAEPPVATYNYPAFLLGSVLAAHAPNRNFLHNSYIQLSSTSIYSAAHPLAFVPAMGVDETPRIGAGRIEITTPATAAAVADIVTGALRTGRYARVVLDEFYLPEKLAYQRVHYIHDNLIHGYCAACRTCFLAGYRGTKAHGAAAQRVARFGLSACPLAALGPAIFSRPDGPAPKFLQDQIALFQPVPEPPALDLGFIKVQLAAYLSSSHDPRPYAARGYPDRAIAPWPAIKSVSAYGRGVYAPLIDLTLADPAGAPPLDLKPYRLLWEHKAAMRGRVRAVAEHLGSAPLRALEPALAGLEASANQIRLESIFYRANPRPESRKKIAASLEQLREAEASLLTRFLAEL
jgi:hypothetical protein